MVCPLFSISGVGERNPCEQGGAGLSFPEGKATAEKQGESGEVYGWNSGAAHGENGRHGVGRLPEAGGQRR